MTIINPFKATALLLLSLSVQLAGRAQVYQLSTPISGSMTMNIMDFAGPSGSSGDFQLNCNSLTETVYLDPAAQTVREVGSISVTPSAQSIVINEIQQVPSQFPNPPESVSGTITVYLAPGGGNVLSFDTGVQPATWNSASQSYAFNGAIGSFLNPIIGSYSLVTGGQTYTGTINYTLANINQYSPGQLSGNSAWTFDQLNSAGYPSAISLGNLGNASQGGVYSSQPSTVADVTAADGFHMQLFPGTAGVTLAAGDLQWSSTGSVTAYLVPEPTSIAMLGLGALVLALLRRHQA